MPPFFRGLNLQTLNQQKRQPGTTAELPSPDYVMTLMR